MLFFTYDANIIIKSKEVQNTFNTAAGTFIEMQQNRKN